MDGSATFTMDTSSTTMNCATQAMDRITQSGTLRPAGVLRESPVACPVSVMVMSVPHACAHEATLWSPLRRSNGVTSRALRRHRPLPATVISERGPFRGGSGGKDNARGRRFPLRHHVPLRLPDLAVDPR